jgi:hypothetical protein
MWGLSKANGRAVHPDLETMWDWPHTITTACALRQKYDSFLELPEMPPVEWWDYPDYIDRHVEKLYPSSKKSHYEVPLDDVDD